jgi:hypothetical protein
MPMMALTSDALKTCMHGLKTHEPICIGRPARFFFMLEAHSPQGPIGHVAASEPLPLGWEVGSGAVGHAAAPVPSLKVR